MNLQELVVSRYENVVAAEPLNDGSAVLFFRHKDLIETETVSFKFYLLLEDSALLNGSELEFSITALKSDYCFAYLAEFTDRLSYDNAIKYLKKRTGVSPGSPYGPYRVFSDISQQLFTLNEIRLFRQMNFHELRRMQFDIETITSDGFEFPSAARAGDEIIIISLSDNTGWEMVLSQNEYSEKELLEEFVKVVAERDPDVLEGHNIFRFDLPYIEQRAKRHKVKLFLGREQHLIKRRNSRFNAAERTINYTRYDIYGRHVVDTFHLALFYDIVHRNLESYGLKYLAKHFQVASEDRTYVDGKDISRVWFEERQKLLDYALDDVRETRAISELLLPSYFYQAQLIPFKFQDCIVRGNATRIDALLVAEYLKNKSSLPRPEESYRFSGGLTESFVEGVFENVWHCDVRSLYPSIIVAGELAPSRDNLNIFNSFLNQLRTFRLAAKDAKNSAENLSEKSSYEALQSSFKVLINSFYGYLGFSQGTFNDFALAENVTSQGRAILTQMKDFLQKKKAVLIEMDTDGIYFQPPPDIKEPKIMEAEIQNILPKGIEVDLDETYQAMFAYKSKNYALLDCNGEVNVTGAALKSRGLEPFQREYIHKIITLLLHKKLSAATALFDDFVTKITTHNCSLSWLAKTETLNDSVDNYVKKMAAGKGRRSAVYELASASERVYNRGDQLTYYVIGDKKRVSVVDNSVLLADNKNNERNENTAYYVGKLTETKKKFEKFFNDSLL